MKETLKNTHNPCSAQQILMKIQGSANSKQRMHRFAVPPPSAKKWSWDELGFFGVEGMMGK